MKQGIKRTLSVRERVWVIPIRRQLLGNNVYESVCFIKLYLAWSQGEKGEVSTQSHIATRVILSATLT